MLNNDRLLCNSLLDNNRLLCHGLLDDDNWEVLRTIGAIVAVMGTLYILAGDFNMTAVELADAGWAHHLHGGIIAPEGITCKTQDRHADVPILPRAHAPSREPRVPPLQGAQGASTCGCSPPSRGCPARS